MSKPDLEPEEAVRVQQALKRLLDEGVFRSRAELGKALDPPVRGQTIGLLISGKNHASRRTALALARVMGVDERELLGPPVPVDMPATLGPRPPRPKGR